MDKMLHNPCAKSLFTLHLKGTLKQNAWVVQLDNSDVPSIVENKLKSKEDA